MSDKIKEYESEDVLFQLQEGAGKDITLSSSIDPDVEDIETVEEKISNIEYAENNLKEIIEIGTKSLKSLSEHINVDTVDFNEETIEIIYAESPKIHNSISGMIRALTTANHKLTTLGIETGKVDDGNFEDDDKQITLSLSVNDLQRKIKEESLSDEKEDS